MDGFIVILLVSVAGAFGAIGYMGGQSNIAYDCKNYGKTEINTKWYDCKPQGASHDR